MFVRLLLLLTLVPIAELFVMLQVHGAIAERYGFKAGLLVTIGSIMATGALGAYLARSQGLGVVRELQRSVAEGRSPGRTLIDGALIVAGGALLLTPGFLSDLLGLSLLIPTTRALWRKALSRWLAGKVGRGEGFVRFGAGPGAGGGSGPGSGGNRGDWGGEPPRGRVIDVTPDDPERP